MIPAVPEYIEKLVPYEPGKPVEELERELGISNSIKLASNENPVGPSPAVVEAIMQNAQNINRYPDGGSYYLKSALSGFLKVSPEEIVIGNGSNEIIELCLRAFVRPDDETVSASGAFLVYDLATRVIGGRAVQVPMKDFTHDLKKMGRAITPKTKVVLISNPNNPTGTAVSAGELESFMESTPRGVMVVIDEAYFEYVRWKNFPDSLSLLSRYDNLLVIRTFSKAYGLAGLRIGYGVANKKVVTIMNKIRQPFNVNYMAQVAALAALKDQEHISRVVTLCQKEKKRIEEFLTRMGLVYVPSKTNFILVKVGGDGRKVYTDLLKRGVIVRAMNAYGFDEYIRVTVGLPEENDRFLSELSSVLGKPRK